MEKPHTRFRTYRQLERAYQRLMTRPLPSRQKLRKVREKYRQLELVVSVEAPG